MFDIDREHPEYKTRKATWRKYRDLYVGGEQLIENAGQYLVARQKEGRDVYSERLSRAFYENYIGSIVDWYAATLFRREPVLTFEGNNTAAQAFFAGFVEDMDRKGSHLVEIFRQQFIHAMVAGTSYLLVDFPRVAGQAETRGQEDAMGASRAYLVDYAPEDVINWSLDERGNFDWAVIRTKAIRKERVEDADWQVETRWTYYDKERFRAYRSNGENRPPVMVDEGMHGLAKLGQVPLFELKIPEGLWLLNRAGSLQLEHFNKSNALSWALTMGLFAMPVVYTEKDWSEVIGESYYLRMNPGDTFGWAEPEGKVYQIAADNLVRLQEEIYRVCYLSQAGGTLDRTGQSGLSKQRDFAITQEVLRSFGDAVKDQLRRVLKAVEGAREDGLDVNVTGLDEFDITDFSTELQQAQQLLALGADSPTLRKEMLKKLALKFLCDARQGIKDRVAAEIECA